MAKETKMFPTIKVWCLPNLTQSELEALFAGIVRAVVSVEELELKGEEDVLILYPRNHMTYGLGMDVAVEISDITIPIHHKHIRKQEIWVNSREESARSMVADRVYAAIRANLLPLLPQLKKIKVKVTPPVPGEINRSWDVEYIKRTI